MIRRIAFTILISTLFFSINSCTKRTYDVQVDGFVYEDCNMKPLINKSISLINDRRDNIDEVRTKTDSTGHFSIRLKGEGSSSLFLEISDVYFGTIQSCQIYAYKKDSAELIINKGSMNIDDTLYISFYNYYYFDSYSPVKDSLLYKIDNKDFNPYSNIKLCRKDLIPENYSPWDQLNELWVKNSLDVYMVWGDGIDDFKNSVRLFNNKKFNSTSKIKKTQIKSCSNSNQINL